MSDATKLANVTIWTAAASRQPVLKKLDMSARLPQLADARARVATIQAKLDRDLQAYRSRTLTNASRKRVK